MKIKFFVSKVFYITICICACILCTSINFNVFLHAHILSNVDKTPPVKMLEDSFSLSSTATWKEFALTKSSPFKDDKWVWISSITVKSKEALKLKKIHVLWHGKKGEKIDALSASLFSKRRQDSCVTPIEENLVCDGIWDKKKQRIIFNIDKKVVSTSDYHMVLSFPHNVEKLLKRGKFVLSQKKLLSILP
ncbi:MAG: hypothetical protein ABH827_03705 [bacterium]